MGGSRQVQRSCFASLAGAGLLFGVLVLPVGGQLPDISTVEPDLVVPELADGDPGPGRRVKQTHPAYAGTAVHHVLYLPEDWKPGASYPVLVEFAGNGPYRNNFGDVSTGRVEGSKLGYGISGGTGFLWLCLPYLDGAAASNVTSWWGTEPDYDPKPTVAYCKATVRWVCDRYGGDPGRVVLCGFSRGAIACNFIGLYDDEIAALWRAFIPYSHYDGVRTGWPYPGADRASARRRLARLKGRPQFICGEGDNSGQTARYLRELEVGDGITIRSTGFRNHNDAWVLRPSPARRALRKWLAEVLAEAGD